MVAFVTISILLRTEKMFRKIDISLLRRGDLVRFEELELAPTWAVEAIEEGQILLELNTIFYKKTKVLKKSTRRKKYVFVEVE